MPKTVSFNNMRFSFRTAELADEALTRALRAKRPIDGMDVLLEKGVSLGEKTFYVVQSTNDVITRKIGYATLPEAQAAAKSLPSHGRTFVVSPDGKWYAYI